MPVLTLTLAKIGFLVLFYLFLFWSFRVVGRVVRGTSQDAGGVDITLSKQPHFEVVEPREHRGTKIPLVNGMSIGRDATCRLQLDDHYVSGTHAQIVARGDDFFIQDVGSTNGTLVNRRQIVEPTRIRRGDTVQIGRTVMEVTR